MRYLEHDDDRMIRVRASVIEDGEAKIEELKTECRRLELLVVEKHERICELEQRLIDYEKRAWPGCRMLSKGDGCTCHLCLADRRIRELEAELGKVNEFNESMREPMNRLRESVGMPAQGEGAVVDAVIAKVAHLRECLKTAEDLIHEVYLQCPDENEWIKKAEAWLEAAAECKEGK